MIDQLDRLEQNVELRVADLEGRVYQAEQWLKAERYSLKEAEEMLDSVHRAAEFARAEINNARHELALGDTRVAHQAERAGYQYSRPTVLISLPFARVGVRLPEDAA